MKIYKSADYIKKGNAAAFESKKSSDEEHSHEYLELVYCLRGSCRQYVNKETYEMSRGDMLFINRGAIHRHFAPTDNFQYINVCVETEKQQGETALKVVFPFMALPEGVQLMSEASAMASFDKEELFEVEGILQAFMRERDRDKLYNDKISDNYINILFLLFLRKLHVIAPKRTTRVVMNEIVEHIEEHLHQEISLAEIAERYHYNKSYFSRVFKEKVGEGFTDYVNRRRILKAKELIAETDLTIEKVIEAVGFNSRSMFYRTFKRLTGMTTAQYRQKFGKKEKQEDFKR